VNRKSSTPTVADAVAGHLSHRRQVKDYRNEVSLLSGPPTGKVTGRRAKVPALAKALGDLNLSRLTAEALADWEFERSGHLSHNRQRGNRFILLYWLRFCIDKRWLPETWVKHFPALPKQAVRREWLRPAQVGLLLRVAKEVLDAYKYFALYTFLQTGVRSAELPSLRTNDLNVSERTLTVRGKGRGDGKVRKIPVSPAFVDAWHEHIARYAIPPAAYLFFSRKPRLTGGPEQDWAWVIDYRKPASTKVFSHIFDDPTKEQARGQLTAAIMRAGRSGSAQPHELPHCAISPLVLRRTFACLALIQHRQTGKGGMPLERLQEAMGHADMNTTKLYLSDVEDYLSVGAESYDVLEAVETALENERARGVGA
jgi:integrase